MNNIYILPEKEILSYPVTVSLNKSGSQKIKLIKAIKDFTNFGLREAKDLMDNMDNYPQVIKAYRTKEQIQKFKDQLQSCDRCEFNIEDIQQLRNRKLIQLGLGNIDDIIEEIAEQDTMNLLSKSFSYHEIKGLLTERYKLIDVENLKQILNID